MPTVDRFHNVPNETRWRTLFDGWRKQLRGLWDHLNQAEVPWAWSERTNVGLLASAHERSTGGWSMVELPIRRNRDEESTAGRFDLWLGCDGWSVHAEAKQVWAPTWGRERIENTIQALNSAKSQVGDLVKLPWTKTVVSLAFVVPYTSRPNLGNSEGLLEEFHEFESQLWDRHDKRSRTFQTHFVLPQHEIRPLDTGHARPRAFPAVILAGRIHKVA